MKNYILSSLLSFHHSFAVYFGPMRSKKWRGKKKIKFSTSEREAVAHTRRLSTTRKIYIISRSSSRSAWWCKWRDVFSSVAGSFFFAVFLWEAFRYFSYVSYHRGRVWRQVTVPVRDNDRAPECVCENEKIQHKRLSLASVSCAKADSVGFTWP